MTTPRREDDPRPTALVTLKAVARVWDDAVRIPLIGSVGLDAVVGLIPGIGDIVGGLVAGYALVVAIQLRAATSVLLRILLNIMVDVLVGALPLVGDAYDVSWKANRRNVALLERWLRDPQRTQRNSTLVLIGIAAGFIASIIAAMWLAAWAVAAVVRWMTG